MDLKEIAEINDLKVEDKAYSLPDLVQESYRVAYRAKQVNDANFLKLTEAHIEHMKAKPSEVAELTESLNTLIALEKLGESAIYEAADGPATGMITVHKRRPRKPITMKNRQLARQRWKKNRGRMMKALKKFRRSARGKSFYRALGKFNARMRDSKEMTLEESILLFKAGNSALTHLAVELEHNPDFKEAFDEATEILSEDLQDLLESIRSNEGVEGSLLESFQDFYDVLASEDEENPEDEEITEE